MRVYLAACLASVVIGIGGYLCLTTLQEPSGIAYATGDARISPQWAWRSVFSSAEASEPSTECSIRKTWQWIFVDFGNPEGESKVCSVSQ